MKNKSGISLAIVAVAVIAGSWFFVTSCGSNSKQETATGNAETPDTTEVVKVDSAAQTTGDTVAVK